MPRKNICRVCQLEQYKMELLRHNNSSKRSYWYKLVTLKREQIEDMQLRRSRALVQFCSFDHFEEAEFIQKDLEVQEGFRIARIEESIKNAEILRQEAETALLQAVVSNIADSNQTDLEPAKISLRDVKRKLVRRRRVLKEYYEKYERRSSEQSKRIDAAKKQCINEQQRVQNNLQGINETQEED